MQDQDTRGDGKRLCNGGYGHECKIGAVVAQTDVISQPRTMVVEAADAVIAGSTVRGTRGPPDATGIAVLDGDAAASEDEMSLAYGRGG